MTSQLAVDRIFAGDCVDILRGLPAGSVDVVFADPPYNLQLQGDLYRPNMSRVIPVDDPWDQFATPQDYDSFTHQWLTACQHVLKETGTLWVIGSYHNIYRVGRILMDLGFWILNDIVWVKLNPTPNMKGTRFTNSHDILLWAQKRRGARYTFNYHGMKMGNDDRQMRSVWELPVCSGRERLTINGAKAHTAQKPEALLWRVITSSTNPGDVVLDPFFGTGTTGAVAKKLGRHWIGIERDPHYVSLAQSRIDTVSPPSMDTPIYTPSNKPKPPRVPFVRLLETGLLEPGQNLRFQKSQHMATIAADGALIFQGKRGSIHQIGTMLTGAPCNGWEHWYFRDEGSGRWESINVLRDRSQL